MCPFGRAYEPDHVTCRSCERQQGPCKAKPKKRPQAAKPICSVEGCNAPVRGNKTICEKHLKRVLRHGDPLIGRKGKKEKPGCKDGNKWSDEELETLARYYEENKGKTFDLDDLAKKLNRSRYGVAMKASRLGLGDYNRKKPGIERYENGIAKKPTRFKGDVEALRAHLSKKQKKYIKENGHQRGMLGKKHTEETKRKVGLGSVKSWASFSEEKKAKKVFRMLKTKAKKGTYAKARPHVTWKQGWREIAGRRIFFRSRWEANYARYLQFLKDRGDILEWEHEPKTFWFEEIKRGVCSYLPDFRVYFGKESYEYHEVKGWMDSRSKTKIKRMRKYYPEETLVVIAADKYREIKEKMGRIISGWES